MFSVFRAGIRRALIRMHSLAFYTRTTHLIESLDRVEH